MNYRQEVRRVISPRIEVLEGEQSAADKIFNSIMTIGMIVFVLFVLGTV